LPISRRELIRRFRRPGFAGPESGGRHLIMIKGNQRIAIPNPHGAGDIDDTLLRRILAQAGITPEEFDKAK
jgi:predicted RNA binding protein YcfA (HicA-like mRNA interferase family)